MTSIQYCVMCAAFLGIAGGAVWYMEGGALTRTVHDVVLTDAGFSPTTTIIKKGDTVRFSTIRDREFWPASNEHPAHGEYPEFDVEYPLKSDETWEFTFFRGGKWGFHDHLYSFHRGVIFVE